MATIIKSGTPGTNGTSGGIPTAGTNGGDGIFTQNGKIGADSIDVLATGGLGGTGGNGVGVGIGGAKGGNGGNAAITLNGNIFNAPAATTVAVHLVANGGNGGPGGTGTPPGTQGKGGNATINANGNIFQPNKILTSIQIDAFATGGTGSTPGNATSTVNGNVFQSSKAVGTVTLAASASGGGVNVATLNGNIVQGNVNNVALYADTTNGTANISGNIVQTNATNTGFVTLEASGGHIAIANNKFTLGLQELDFSINSTSPYDVSITGNTLKGTGANIFKFSDVATPGPLVDSVSINLANQTFIFDGQASNAISGFGTLVGMGNAIYTFVGDDNVNTLTGAGLNDTVTGGKGNDALNGNAGIDTAIYTGNRTDYTIAVNAAGNGTVTDTIANRDGADTLTSIERLQFADGIYNTTTGIFTGVNHAPVLDASKSPALANEPTNAPAPVGAVGTLVSNLVDFAVPAGQVDNVTDIDAGAQLGIALTGTDTANGSWWYSINGGTNWTAVPAVTDASALLLAADANTRLYFQPNLGYTGTDALAITFRAWDQTSGANGQAGVNVSGANNGGATAFSTASDTASVTITAVVNQPPMATNLNAAENYIEDQPLNLTDIVASDVDSPNVTATLTLSATAAGALTTGTSGAVTSTYNTLTGVWTASGAIADVNTLLANVSFVPAANYNGNFTIATKVDDGSGGIVTGTKNITGTPVNDAPLGASSTITVLEDGSRTFTAADFGFSDPVDAASASGPNTLANVIITTLPMAGSLTYNNIAVTLNQSIAAANLGLLKFTPAANASGNGYASFGFKVQDNGGTANGGVDTSSGNIITFNVTSVNDAPTGANNTFSVLEDGSRTFTAADFGFSDAADAPTPNNLQNIIITGAPSAGTLTYNNAAIGAYPFTVAAANIGLLKFTPAANANGNGYASFGFQLQDDGGTLNGGVDTSAGNTITFNVTPVNDAPTGANNTITILEDGSRTFTAADFGFSDAADAPTPNNLLNVIITGAPAAGTLTYNNAAIGAYPFVVAAANIGLLKFTPAANANGNGYASFGFKVQDDGGTLNGGVNISTGNTITFNVTPVNDAPVANNDSYVTAQNVTLVVPQGTGLIANDTDIDGDTLTTSFITTPTHGSLGINSNGAFTYTPNAGFTGTDTFTYRVTDGTVDSNTATVTIKVDGAPVALNDSYSTGLNTPLVVPAGMGVQANDSDPESDPLTSTVVVGPTHGGLTLNPDGSFTYTPNVGYSGADSFTYKDNDGTLDSNTATVNISVATGGAFTGPGALMGTPFDDIFIPVAGTTSIDGLGNTPTGGDTVVFSNATSGVTATTDAGAGIQDWTSSGLGMTSLTNIENLTGSSFDDVLSGTDGVRNTLNGGDGNDTLLATTGGGGFGDTLNGGNGNDTADFSLSTDPTGVVVDLTIAGVQDVGTSAADPITLNSIENLTGSDYNDVLIGNAGDNVLNGGLGADTLIGGGGNDVLDGGDGVGDTADYSDGTQNGLKVDLNTGTSSGAGLGNDMLSNINNINGSTFNDTLIGDDNANTIFGDAGNDIIDGRGGINTLDGGIGTDTAYFTGREADGNYAVIGTTTVANGALGIIDSGMVSIERLKFLSPTHVSDVDNNGYGDQIYQKSDGTIQVVTQGPVPVTSTLSVNPGAAYHVVGTGQFDPDNSRQSGLLLQDTSGNLGLITGINGANSSALIPLTGAAYSTSWTAIGTGDFNGDASSDVLMWNAAGNKAEILTLKANGTDAAGFVNSISDVIAPGAANWKPISSGDFNGDGKSDIVWQNSSTKQVEVYLMDDTTGPTATTLNTPTALAATGLTALGTGDFNSDGKSDLLFQNSSGQAVIWFMNGDSHAGTKTVSKPGAGFTVSGAQDVDNNGYSDLIWSNSGTGAVTATELGGTSSLVSTSVIGSASLVPQAGGFHLVASTGGG